MTRFVPLALIVALAGAALGLSGAFATSADIRLGPGDDATFRCSSGGPVVSFVDATTIVARCQATAETAAAPVRTPAPSVPAAEASTKVPPRTASPGATGSIQGTFPRPAEGNAVPTRTASPAAAAKTAAATMTAPSPSPTPFPQFYPTPPPAVAPPIPGTIAPPVKCTWHEDLRVPVRLLPVGLSIPCNGPEE